jgi:two-component system response regulator HydG
MKRLPGAVVDTAEEAGIESMAGKSLNEVEKEHIRHTLDLVRNNRAEAAKLLKIGERTLYRKIKEYDL